MKYFILLNILYSLFLIVLISSLNSGGVMLVHDIRKNESRVIDFRETAPSAIREEMLQFNLEERVRRKHLVYIFTRWQPILEKHLVQI